MSKPWGKLQIGWIRHAKFLALSGNAICLWLEIKDHSDENLTDGIVPMLAVRRMRFYSRANIEALMRSAGPRPTGELRAPLVEAFEIGGVPHIKMRKYLDHNDNRETVLARLERAENEREKDKQRKQAWRNAKTSGLASGRTSGVSSDTRPASRPEDVTPGVRAASGSLQKQLTETTTRVPQEQELSARSKRPIFSGQRITVFEWMLDDCLRALGSHADEFDIDAWFWDLDARLVKNGQIAPKRDGGEWLQAQLLAECQKRGIPLRIATVADAQPSYEQKRIEDAIAVAKYLGIDPSKAGIPQ
jgi:hypothetical protein